MGTAQSVLSEKFEGQRLWVLYLHILNLLVFFFGWGGIWGYVCYRIKLTHSL